MTTTPNRVTFGPFPKLTPGNDCNGAVVSIGGRPAGRIVRVVDWRDAGGVTSVTYRAKVTGYTWQSAGWVSAEDDERAYATLAEVRAVARAQVLAAVAGKA